MWDMNSTFSGSEVMANNTVFHREDKLQGQGGYVKNHGTARKVLSQEMYVWKIKALLLLVRKLWPRLKCFKRRSNFKVKRAKILVQMERPWHKESTCEIWKMKNLSVMFGKLWPRKFFIKRSNFKVKVSRSKITHGYVLSQGMHMWNMKALPIVVHEL